MKSSISNEEKCVNQGFLCACCHCESHYLRSIDKSFYNLVPECNLEYLLLSSNQNQNPFKPNLNTYSKTKPRQTDISDFGNPKFRFELRGLKTHFLKRAPGVNQSDQTSK